MAACAAGHNSTATDFCDVCGMRIEGAGPPVPSPASAGIAEPAPSGASPSPAPAQAEPCPQCGTGRNGQFCEVCGFDFAVGPPARQAGPATTTGAAWTAVVRADRPYFDKVIAASGPDAAAITFPAYCPERRFALQGAEMRIGRRSVSRGLEPEIDLTGPPTDPGISHLHAVLVSQPDGSWSVLDPGSSNGTQVNGADLAVGEPVALLDGDQVSLGAWTVLTVREPACGD